MVHSVFEELESNSLLFDFNPLLIGTENAVFKKSFYGHDTGHLDAILKGNHS